MEYVVFIHESPQRMIKLVSGLLDVSKIEAGRLEINLQLINLAEFIQEIIDANSISTKDPHCQIRFSKPQEKLPPIQADPMLLRQIIENLLVNAIRYSPGEKCTIVVGLEKKGTEDFVISVKDNGMGIPIEAQPKIFEKFFRAENAIKVETDGSGIGLYVVKLLVETFAGKIWFESEEGKGTTFYISLPVAPHKAKRGTQPLAAS